MRDQEDSATVANAVQKDATRLVDLERENKQLREQVMYYR